MRNLHLWFAAVLGVLLVTFASTVLWIATAESLWLDELHTSWAVSGSWQEIASRAAAGNQTPLYFWLVSVVSQTLGHQNNQQSEWILRLPSAMAWLLALGLVAWQVCSKAPPRGSQNGLFAMSIVAWIVLDRLQWFFASEARPYALVQLVSLAGWCCVEAIVRDKGQHTRKLVVVWSLLSIANIYLHLTAVLPVVFQWLTAIGLVGWSRYWMGRKLSGNGGDIEEERSGQWSQATTSQATTSQITTVWLMAAVGVALALLPILQLAFPVWQRREQWTSFAGDVSFYRATTLFPFGPVLVCVFIGRLVDQLWRDKSLPQITTATEVRCLWWIAMLGPWLSAWTLTAIGIAPMFHQRFIFASALPLFVVGAIELLRCRRSSIRWATCLAVAIAIAFSQGSVSIWRTGYLVGNLRSEDWRGATQWVNDHYGVGEPLLCSSGLIEANSTATNPHRLPLESNFAEYLSFPLLGVYRVPESTEPQSAEQKADITPLLSDHRQWAAQVANRLDEASTRPNRMWLLYRGAPGRLKTKLSEFLAHMKAKGIELEASEPVHFGNLHVVELRCF